MSRLLRRATILSSLVFALVLQTPMVLAGTDTPIVFKLPSGLDPTKVFVTITGTSNPVPAAYRLDGSGSQIPLYNLTSYSMAELTGANSIGGGAPAGLPGFVLKDGCTGARVYVSYCLADAVSGQHGLIGLNTAHYPQPDPLKSTDINYNVRYQYFEPTVNDTGIHVDLTYIDVMAISMSLRAVNAPNSVKNSPLLTRVGARTLIQAIAKAGNTVGQNIVPSATSLPPDHNFVRALPPMATAGIYHDWSYYLKTFLQGKQILLEGCFAGSESALISQAERKASQTYKYIATFSENGNATLTAQPQSGQYSTACGSITGNKHGVGNNSTITMNFDDLNSINGIYGADAKSTMTYVNPSGVTETINASNITNDVFGWVIGDLLSAINFGYAGSTVQFSGVSIGNMPSTNMWGGTDINGNHVLLKDTPAGNGIIFSKAQPVEPRNYNTYADAIYPYTDAYGFAFMDRLGQVLLEFDTPKDPNAYLEVDLLSDTIPHGALSVNMLLLDQ